MAELFNPYSFTLPRYPNNPYGQVYSTPVQSQRPAPNTFQWVQGEAGAEAFLVAPNQSVILMDSNAPVIYFKSADASGRYLPMKTYDLVERITPVKPVPEQAQPIDTGSFVKRDEIGELVAKEVDRYLNTPVKKEA